MKKIVPKSKQESKDVATASTLNLPEVIVKKLNNNPHIKEGIFDIVLVSYEDLRRLPDNPYNWKLHPLRQREVLQAAIKANSWARALVFNVTTGRLLDGHCRKEIAIKERMQNIPIALARIPEHKELSVLKSADPIGTLYRINAVAFENLNKLLQKQQATLEGLKEAEVEALQKLEMDLDEFVEEVKQGERVDELLPKAQKPRKEEEDTIEVEELEEEDEVEIEEPKVVHEVLDNDVLFPSDLPFGMPPLLESLLAGPEDLPQAVWTPRKDVSQPINYLFQSHMRGIVPKERAHPGTICFFVDDWRIDIFFSDADTTTREFLEEGYHTVCELDYSMYLDWPDALRIWNLYRARWCARFHQEVGFRVLPNLRSLRWAKSPTIEKVDKSILEQDIHLQLDTLPGKVPCAITSVNATADTWGNKMLALAIDTWKTRKGLEHLVIYGNLKGRKYLEGLLPSGINYVWINSYHAERKLEGDLKSEVRV